MIGKKYYYVSAFGDIGEYTDNDSPFDWFAYAMGNMFDRIEDAKLYAKDIERKWQWLRNRGAKIVQGTSDAYIIELLNDSERFMGCIPK